MLKNVLFGALTKVLKPKVFSPSCQIHTGNVNQKWLEYNEKVYPPQGPDETPRPAFVCHVKENNKYSYKKLWYVAVFVRGMTVDEALKQLEFINKKGAKIVRNTILEAVDLAVKEHNVQYKTDLWISESFVGKGSNIKGLRRCAKARMNKIIYRYTHYFVTLEEGKPPEHYYHYKRPQTGPELLDMWLTKMRNRKITGSL